MRTYRNTVTGAVIVTPCEIHGDVWREETPAKQPEPPKKEAKRDGRTVRNRK